MKIISKISDKISGFFGSIFGKQAKIKEARGTTISTDSIRADPLLTSSAFRGNELLIKPDTSNSIMKSSAVDQTIIIATKSNSIMQTHMINNISPSEKMHNIPQTKISAEQYGPRKLFFEATQSIEDEEDAEIEEPIKMGSDSIKQTEVTNSPPVIRTPVSRPKDIVGATKAPKRKNSQKADSAAKEKRKIAVQKFREEMDARLNKLKEKRETKTKKK